jgi:hypothetical protein
MFALLDGLVTEDEFKKLRDLIIDFHYAGQELSIKDFLPTIIGTLAIISGLFGPWIIFRLQRSKELRRDLAKLFAEFRHYSKEYSIVFTQYNRLSLQMSLYSFHTNYYREIIKKLETENKAVPESAEAKFKYYQSLFVQLHDSTMDWNQQTKSLRFKAVRPLFEIEYLTVAEKLPKLIEEFEAVTIYQMDKRNPPTLEQLEDETFLQQVMDKDVYILKGRLDNLSKQIADHLKSVRGDVLY